VSVRSDERLTLECRRCGRCYEEWPLPAPDVACDPALADPGFLAAAATTTCPYCGHTDCRATTGPR
jgi:hypothetical protein